MAVDVFARIRARAALVIARFGGDIGFYAETDLITALFTGKAVQPAGDGDQFDVRGLVLVNPVLLLVAADGMNGTPAPGMFLKWADVYYAVVRVTPVVPNGTAPIYYKVIGTT